MEIAYINRLLAERPTFDLPTRPENSELLSKYVVKTGTTICGVKCKEGVVIAADKRATMGQLISTGEMVKLFKLTPRIWGAGAGTAADCMKVAAHMQGDMKLFELQLGRPTRVQTIVGRLSTKLFEHQGNLGCHYIIGGIDSTGAHLARISSDGSTHFGPFHCMGSGGLHAQTVMSAGYSDDMSIEFAQNLASRSIVAGIENDLYSGTSVDMIVIRTNSPDTPEITSGPLYAYKPFDLLKFDEQQ